MSAVDILFQACYLIFVMTRQHEYMNEKHLEDGADGMVSNIK